MTDWYAELTRAIQTTKIAPAQVANIFFNDWIVPYGIPDTVLSDNGQRFICKLFTTVPSYLVTTKPTTTAFYPQTNGHAEKYNKTTVSRLRLYVTDNKNSWDIFVQLVTYAYNCQVHFSTAEMPFSVVLFQHTPCSSTIDSSTALPLNANNAKDPSSNDDLLYCNWPQWKPESVEDWQRNKHAISVTSTRRWRAFLFLQLAKWFTKTGQYGLCSAQIGKLLRNITIYCCARQVLLK